MNERWRARLEGWADRAGLLTVLRPIRAAFAGMLPSERRLVRHHRQRFEAFRDRYTTILAPAPVQSSAHAPNGLALFVTTGFPTFIELETAMIKGFQRAGFDVGALHIGGPSRFVVPYYRMAGAKHFYSWKAFKPAPDLAAADAMLERCDSVEQVLEIEEHGIRVGRFAVSTALRRLRKGSLRLDVRADAQALAYYLAEARQTAVGANRFIQAVRPRLGVVADTEYSPTAEIFDAFLTNGVDVVQYDTAHKSNAVMLHRYTRQNRNQHPWSLSDESWETVRTMPWTLRERRLVQEELAAGYGSGDWFSACGTQFGTRQESADRLRRALELDASKKTAVIFSHILWDAPVVWGTRLFRTYEDWLVETVKAACANPRLNWLIKIHPANIGKGQKEGFEEEPAEVNVIREQIGALPSHVRLLPADTSISTISLLGVTDYCLTVRGTVGIEAARLGIPVLNAGGGRYDRRGFTMDPCTTAEYLETIKRLQSVPPLPVEQRELADRFAYGYLLLRPFEFTSVHFGFRQGTHMGKPWIVAAGDIELKHAADWTSAPDIHAFADWLTRNAQPDFLKQIPSPGEMPAETAKASAG